MKFFREGLLCTMLLFGIVNLFFDLNKYLLLANGIYMIFVLIKSGYDYKNHKVVNANYLYYLLYYCFPIALVNTILFGICLLEIKYIKYVYLLFILISSIVFIIKNNKNKLKIY